MSINRALLEYFEGVRFFENNSLDAALNHFQKSLQLEKHFKTCHQIYKIYDKLGNEEYAYKYICIAYELNKNNDAVAIDLAKKMISRGLIDQAKSIILEILSRNPSYGPAKKIINSIMS